MHTQNVRIHGVMDYRKDCYYIGTLCQKKVEWFWENTPLGLFHLEMKGGMGRRKFLAPPSPHPDSLSVRYPATHTGKGKKLSGSVVSQCSTGWFKKNLLECMQSLTVISMVCKTGCVSILINLLGIPSLQCPQDGTKWAKSHYIRWSFIVITGVFFGLKVERGDGSKLVKIRNSFVDPPSFSGKFTIFSYTPLPTFNIFHRHPTFRPIPPSGNKSTFP